MSKRSQDTPAEEPDGENPHIRFRGGPRQGDRPGLLNSIDDVLSEVPYAVVALPERFSLDHHAEIAKAAYFRAERRGFARGHEVEDWLEAENELRRRFIGQGRQPS